MMLWTGKKQQGKISTEVRLYSRSSSATSIQVEAIIFSTNNAFIDSRAARVQAEKNMTTGHACRNSRHRPHRLKCAVFHCFVQLVVLVIDDVLL